MKKGKVCDSQSWCTKLMQINFRKTRLYDVMLSLLNELVLRGQKVFFMKLWKEGRLNYLWVCAPKTDMGTKNPDGDKQNPITKITQEFVFP